MPEVYITRTSSFLPNDLISNEEMEDYLGYVNGAKSRSKSIVLRNNKIKGRHYAITKEGVATHTNSQMVSLAIKKLFESNPEEIKEVDLLSCGTSSPDQMMPSHAVMVHGWLPEMKSIEVVSPSGVCCSGMHAFKYAYMSIKIGDKKKAITTGSERLSRVLRSEQFEDEVKHLEALEQNPMVAFQKDFLRWMLSDGAATFLLEDKPNPNGLNLKVEWVEGISYANVQEACMYMAAEKEEDGTLKSYMDYAPEDIMHESVMTIKQDTRLLDKNIVSLGFNHLIKILKDKNQNVDEVDHFLPHLSSFFFEDKIADILESNGMGIPKEKWFTNLSSKGNVGAGSIYLMVDELLNSGRLKKGEKVLLAVPESSRFSYVFCYLTVC
ncbi:beta-ketoacyl-ACP synthase III [Reichenbachiella agarivorans]|uniref:Beta-ketoacyl-ACP synthase III n=1 Tax=Reichenbachiella agarivorans TaxID=2979464 RepID=A0ABY6CR76_9BACT|nr:beta-ketoacyl-ACP synthase III [Reichenbachiella agarivorans]UXP32545.1 beta-ketoacyl-ACP synthase III [Reichenbachiella agarivorans]